MWNTAPETDLIYITVVGLVIDISVIGCTRCLLIVILRYMLLHTSHYTCLLNHNKPVKHWCYNKIIFVVLKSLILLYQLCIYNDVGKFHWIGFWGFKDPFPLRKISVGPENFFCLRAISSAWKSNKNCLSEENFPKLKWAFAVFLAAAQNTLNTLRTPKKYVCVYMELVVLIIY